MSDKEIVFEFAEIFGLNEGQTWLLKIILDLEPDSQKKLVEKYNEIMTQIGKKEKLYGTSGVSKACTQLKDRHLIKQIVGFRNRLKYDLAEDGLEWIRKCTRQLEFIRLERILNKIPPEINDGPEVYDAQSFFQRERELYNNGDYWGAKEALESDDKKNISVYKESYRQRLLGWCSYYISYKKIKDPTDTKETESFYRASQARDAFIQVLRISKSAEDVDSALAGLPLVYYLLLNESKKAFQVVEKAEKIARNLGPIYNTKALLKRNEKLHIEALEAFSKSFQIAEKNKDYRTCGNASNNKAKVLKFMFPELVKLKLDRKLLKQFKKEIKTQFENAEKHYKKYEEKNKQSAKFHLEGITNQINELENTPPYNFY